MLEGSPTSVVDYPGKHNERLLPREMILSFPTTRRRPGAVANGLPNDKS